MTGRIIKADRPAFLCSKLKIKPMKKMLLILMTVTSTLAVYPQAVPNSGFENWSSIAYEDPIGWNTGNPRDVPRLGIPPITKVAGVSGYAVRIQSNIVGTDTSDSYILDTNDPCSDPPQWTGGMPYVQQPTAITGFFRYNLLGNDTAVLLVIFRKNGVHIGDNFILIRGTGTQSTFTSFSYPVTCSGVPDTIIIAAATSSKGTGATNGSFIEFDNLAFAGTTQAIPGGDFDNWTTKSYDVPTGWVSWGSGVSKTTTVYSGTYAIRLETAEEMCGNYNSSGVSTGHMTSSSGPQGGIPYTNTNDTICGYYKYAPAGSDTAGIYVSLTKNGAGVGGNYGQLPAAAVYTYFEFPVQAGITPDTIRVDLQSSKWPSTAANIGSVLYVDNLYLKSSPMGIFGAGSISNMNIFPNPANEVVTVKFEKELLITGIAVYSVTGKKERVPGFTGNAVSLKVDISGLQSGIYLLEVKTAEGSVRKRFVKE